MEEFPKLVNSHDDSVISINNSSFSIGRSLSCDHIIQSLGVSRFHCVIKKSDDRWTLFDRSTNGTVVNSVVYKFNESVDLKHGDAVNLGPENLDYVFITNKQSDESQLETVMESQESPISLDVVAEFEQPFDMEVKSEPNTEKKKPQDDPCPNKQNLDIMENELTCSICSELFIKAVTLNCSHTFCKFCIEEWRNTKPSCPICRKCITTVAPTLVLNNFIDKIIETQSDEVKEMRKTLTRQREEVIANVASSSHVEPNESHGVIEIFSGDDEDDDDDDDDDSDYSCLSDDHDYDVYDCYLSGSARSGRGERYYGGYGRCFICNQSGHWANGCPFKRR